LFSLENGLVPAPCLPEVRAGRYISQRTLHKENQMETFLETNDSWTLTLQRWVLGGVLFAHGAQKLLGWFGGYGFAETMGYFTGALHVPAPLAFLVILAESFGAVGLILGLGTRLGAFGAAAVMIGAILMTHLPNGFYMNWAGSQKGEGFEFHLLALALAIPLLIQGGGKFALDSWLASWLAKPRERVSSPLAV
jgi:putative oxidoreductase